MRQLAIAALALLLATSCGKRQTEEVGGTTDTTLAPEAGISAEPEAPPGELSFDQRQQFGETIRQQLAGIDAEIDQLAAQAKSKGGAVSDRALARIRASRRAVNNDLKRVETATADTWEQVRNRVTRAVEDLEETMGAAQPK
ncbi:MAG TPA: hypothetical protein VF252_10285 [Gemmatimonadales bacterium]